MVEEVYSSHFIFHFDVFLNKLIDWTIMNVTSLTYGLFLSFFKAQLKHNLVSVCVSKINNETQIWNGTRESK